MKNAAISCDDLEKLSERAVEQARERAARVLEEAELEQAAGGLASLKVPIIFGLIFPDEVLKESALVKAAL